MTRKEAFAKIKELLFGEQQFEQAKLADGTVVVWEGELGTGTALFVIDEAGTQQAAPDGEHTLEDGTIVTIAGGLVVTVSPKEQEEEEVEIEVENASEKEKKDEMAGEMEMMLEKLAEKVAALETKIEEMSKKEAMSSEEVDAKVSEVKNELENKFAAIKETVEAIAAEPAAEEAQPVKGAFKKAPKNKIEELAKTIQNLKK